MNNKEYNWYKFLNVPGFGAKSRYYVYTCLVKSNLTINDLFTQSISELEDLLPEIGKGKLSRAKHAALNEVNEDKVFEQYEKLKSEKVQIIGLDDERYPYTVLSNLRDNAPTVLFCQGYLPLLQTKGVSIVGARDVSEYAVMLTKRIGARLAENGYNVTSGYAKGVDTAAHFGALEAGGTTTMILSFGTNYINIKKDLKDLDWEKNTLFVSQFLPFEKFSGPNAMIRNKLVCAMSKAVIVICSGPEKYASGKQSGTFDAGKTALEMKVPLFVLSSEVLKEAPQGNIDLIKLGGIPLANGNELIDYLHNLDKELLKNDMKDNEGNTKESGPPQMTFNF